ncbi:unnamed protein product [Hymenolepis diminuta]|uniref:Uncharacterized protein n=1 Tax=Hymenolepis diminuta TaxID=6216 RepID=A0A564Z5G1_HYMDI|nr:unnamed protein product [Hymenolepis diminuta]
MKARISTVVRNIFTQMNFSIPTKDPKNYMKSHGIFITVIFIRAAWQISPTPFELPCCFVSLTDAVTSYFSANESCRNN